MKKKLCIFIALILLAGLISFPPPSRAEESDVRVLLSTEGRDTLTLTLAGTYTLDGAEITGGTLTVAVSGTEVVVTHSELGQLFTGDGVTLTTQDRTNLFTLATADAKERTYRGSVTFTVSNGAVQAVNTVGMEDYMLGVAVPEVGRDAPEALLKAAMITAKGYALAEMGVSGSKAYDVKDTSSDQVYNGFYPTADKAIACAAEVAELTLMYNGKAIKTHYGASNGGVVLTPKAKWGGSQEYSKAYECKFDPFDITRSGVANLMVPVTGSAPNTLPEKLYQYLLEKAGAEAITEITDVAGYVSGDHPQGYAPQDGFRITMTVTKGGSAETKTLDVTFDDLSRENVILTDNSIRFAVSVKEGLWLLCWGQSSGPRVGMSHKGALRMAELGYSYVDILKFYYPNAELKKSDGTIVETHKDLSTEGVMEKLRSEENNNITKLGYVSAEGAQIMSKESNSADVCARPSVLSRFGIYKTSGDWYYGIDMETGVQGWISKKSVTIGDPPDHTPAPTATPTPSPSDTPEPTPSETPEATDTPEPTETAGPTTSPDATGSASPSGSPDATPSEPPEASQTPDATPSETPEATPSETPEATQTPDPSPSETPEASQTPDPSPSETPEATQTPEPSPSETPEASQTPDPTDQPEGTIRGRITSPNLAIREGPAVTTKSFGQFYQGQLVYIYYQEGDYFYVKVAGTEVYGYGSARFIEPESEVPQKPEATQTPEPSPSETPEPTPTPTATPEPTPTGPYTEPTEEMIKKAKKGVLVSSGVNMRKGPGTGYDKVATGLKSGTELTVYLLDNGWYFLKVNSTKKYGYISKEFVELYDDDATPKPTKKPTEEPAIRLSQGDVNGDGLISAADAALILRYDAGLIDWPDNDPRFEAADMDGDDQVTALDAKAILKSVAGRLAR